MHQVAEAVGLLRPLPRHPAGLAMLLPGLGIDPVVLVERRDDHIGDLRFAFRMTGLARELEPDLAEARRATKC